MGIAIALLVGLLGSCIFGSGGLLRLWHLQSERGTLGDETYRLLEKNDELRQSILRLRRSDRALERLARQELGLVRDGEVVYRFRSRPATAYAEPAAPVSDSASAGSAED